MSSPRADISENDLYSCWPGALELLVKDQTTGDTILWATDDYEGRGEGYYADERITIPLITGKNGDVIVPRTYKHADDQADRTKEKAEVFTPTWVVNCQINILDDEWLGYAGAFNKVSEDKRQIEATRNKVAFPDEAEDEAQAQDDELRTWQSYVRRGFLEITCGEAPYIVNRYDAADGNAVEIPERVSILDRKLRVINENLEAGHDHEREEWLSWVKRAYKSVYGYEWQGDSLLIARENLLFTFFDAYRARYGCDPELEDVLEVAEIVSWNFFQMDGLKYVVPNTCHEEAPRFEESLFDEDVEDSRECPGCRKGDVDAHNGVFAKTMDWTGKKPRAVEFRKLRG